MQLSTVIQSDHSLAILDKVIEIGNNSQRCKSNRIQSEQSQVDTTNGCLGYKPGSHKSGLLPHQPTNTLGFSQVLPRPKKIQNIPPAQPLNAKYLNVDFF